MKKKIKYVLFMLLALTVSMGVVGQAKALDDSGHIGNNDSNACSSYICYSLRINGDPLQGIRVSLVDGTGKRITGTISVDLLRSHALVSGANSNWDSGKLVMDKGPNFKRSYYMNTRNEVLSKYSLKTTTALPTVYYWSMVPKYINVDGTGSDDATKRLESLFLADTYATKKVMSLMGCDYSTYKCGNYQMDYENTYILIEPLAYIRIHVSDDYGTGYYGTASEVYSMTTTHFSDLWAKKYPLAIFVSKTKATNLSKKYSNLNISPNKIAGLTTITGNETSNFSSYMDSSKKYGVAAGHVFFPDITCSTSKYPNKKLESTSPKTQNFCCKLYAEKDYLGHQYTMAEANVKYDEKKGTGFKDQLYCCLHKCGTTTNTCPTTTYPNTTPVASSPQTCCKTYGEYTTTQAKTYYASKGKSQVYCCLHPSDNRCTTATSCNTTPTVNITNDCANSTSGEISDIDDWTCIFKTISASKNTYDGQFYTSNGASVSNSYCNVACREDINYTLSNSFTIKAGRTFTIYDSDNMTNSEIGVVLSPPTFTGTSTCRTGYRSASVQNATINVSQFLSDYAAANESVQNAWDALQINIAKQKSLDSARIVSSHQAGHNCDTYSTCNYSCCVSYDMKTGKCLKTGTCKRDCEPCIEWHHGSRYYTLYNWRGTTYYYKGKGYTISYTTGSDGSSEHGERPSDFNTSDAAYRAAVNTRDALLLKIKQCNNYQRTYQEFNPEVSFAYGEEKYQSSYSLKKFYSEITSNSTYYNSSNNVTGTHTWNTNRYDNVTGFIYDSYSIFGSSSTTKKYVCSGELQPCQASTVQYPSNSWVEQVTTRIYEYSLPDNVYRYVSKQGISYSNEYEAINAGVAYHDMKYSNLPIAYTTLGGEYEYYYEFYYDSTGDENLFGKNQKYIKYNPENLFDKGDTNYYPSGSSSPIEITDATGYLCTYTVENDIIPPDDTNTTNGGNDDGTPLKDINVVYRPISLTNPFPSITGDGRAAGSNWQGTTSSGKSFIDTYITNNRGVSGEDVYEETPMYQFVLTPNNMRAIRKYNNSTGNDYNDYTLDCDDGSYCRSTFLDSGVGKGYFKFTSTNSDGGSCYGSSNTDWENCRYTHLGG